MVVAIHTSVKGRGRYKVEGLSSSEYMKTFLELRLPRHNGIMQASASMTTGNVLVTFNSDNTHDSIQTLIQSVLREAEESLPSAGEFSKKSFDKKERGGTRIRRAIKDLLFPKEEAPPPWHLMESEEVLGELSTDYYRGLDESQVAERLKQFGSNTLPEAPPRSGLQIFLGQLNSLPVYLLGAAAGVSMLTGGFLDAAVIGGVVVANAIIGYFTESQAEKTIHSLKTFVRPAAEVLRDGRYTLANAESIVKGDIVVLKPGVSVPADCRIVYADYLNIDESILTGESLPATKDRLALSGENIAVADRRNMAFMGTLVTGGHGLAVVVATGQNTEIGQLQTLLGEISAPETPIERQLSKLGNQLVLMCGCVCGVVFLMGFIRGYGILQMLRTAISLAAAAVPEGLPAAATINFALGIKRMRSHGVLIRQLQAVETLGAVQTVCMDKTGTITQNKMTVQRIYSGHLCVQVHNGGFKAGARSVDVVEFEEFRRLFDVCCLCSESSVERGEGCDSVCGSPTENALMRMAMDAGIDAFRLREEHERIKVHHRSESRLFMSTINEKPGGGKNPFREGESSGGPGHVQMAGHSGRDGPLDRGVRAGNRNRKRENGRRRASRSGIRLQGA